MPGEKARLTSFLPCDHIFRYDAFENEIFNLDCLPTPLLHCIYNQLKKMMVTSLL